MKVTELPNVRAIKAKSKLKNRGRVFNNFSQKTEEKINLEKTKSNPSKTSKQEVDIILAWCGAFKYFLFALILLCLLQTIEIYSQG